MSIYVIGDYGTDVYHVGKVRGVSAEAPIPVLKNMYTIQLPAMAGNVVGNLEALGCNVEKLDSNARFSPRKNRLYTEDGVQLARWDTWDRCDPYIVDDLIPLLDADAIVVADYAKGAIGPVVTDILRETTIPLFVDTKQDPTPWIGSRAVLFPNLAEYHQFEEKYKWIEHVILKQGPLGLAYMNYGQIIMTSPASAERAQCVNGAGDTVLAAFVMAVLSGGGLRQCLDFANAAAAEVVEQPFLSRTTTLGAVIRRYEQGGVGEFIRREGNTNETNNHTTAQYNPIGDGAATSGNLHVSPLPEGGDSGCGAGSANPSDEARPITWNGFAVVGDDGRVINQYEFDWSDSGTD